MKYLAILHPVEIMNNNGENDITDTIQNLPIYPFCF